MHDFNLIPEISVSEKGLSDNIGEQFRLFKDSFIAKTSNLCLGCGYEPIEKSKLQFHIIDWDGKDINTAKCVLLCEACHSIKHFDTTSDKDWVRLCNSTFSQEEIVKRCRAKAAAKDIAENRIILLKKNPKELLEEMKMPGYKKNDRIKIVFGKNFPWID